MLKQKHQKILRTGKIKSKMNENKLNDKITKHNSEVDYNHSSISWITDIIACIIFLPYIIMVIYRRTKYNEYKKPFD